MNMDDMFMGWVKISHEDILADLDKAYIEDMEWELGKLFEKRKKHSEKFGDFRKKIKKACIWENEISDIWGFTLFFSFSEKEKENYIKLGNHWFKNDTEESTMGMSNSIMKTPYLQHKVTDIIEELYKSCKGIFKIVKNNWELN